jgi:cytochrome P450
MSDALASYDPLEAFSPEVNRDPQPFYAMQRAIGPVLPGAFGGWSFVSREACEYALQNPAEFSSGMEAVDLGQSVPLIPLQVDPPEHVKYRRLLDPLFAPRLMNPLEDDITKLVNDLIDKVIDEQGCDFTSAMSVPLPSEVFLTLLGLPLDRLPEFLVMKDGIIHPPGDTPEEQMVTRNKAARDIEAYFTEQMELRRANPSDDMVSRFLAAEVGGEKLTDEEILGVLFLFLIAGLDTVTDTLECFFYFLATHPEHRRQIVEDPSLIPAAVEELLRWETPVTAVPRLATKDMEIMGCPIKAGEGIGVMIGSANTDPSGYEDADVVDFSRNPKHWAFGGGVHRCLGSHLARLELRIVMREWHRRIPEYSLPEGFVPEVSPGLRQFASLPLIFG